VDKNIYPQYYEIIRKPMDLSRLKSRLNIGKYKVLSKFESDVRLIFRNCYIFNDPSSFLSQQAHILECYFNKEWANDLEKFKLSKLSETTSSSLNINNENSIENSYVMDNSKIKNSSKKLKTNDYVNNEVSIKARTSMSPEPMEHSKTIIYLKNNTNANTLTNGLTKNEKGKDYQEDDFNSVKSKRSSLYSSEKERNTVKERIHKVKNEVNDSNSNVSEKNKSNLENKIKLNNTRSISDLTEVSAKRMKKDNSSNQENPKENRSFSESKEQSNTFVKSEEYNKCEFILRRMKKHKYGGPFLEPVDPVALNIPTYFTIIKHPMDISTIENNLTHGKYTSIIGFYKDVDLMFRNCFKFNLPEEYVYQAGKSLQAFFQKEWGNANLPTIKSTDKRIRHSSREPSITESEIKKKDDHRSSNREHEREHEHNHDRDRDINKSPNKSLERENSSNRHRESSNRNEGLEELSKSSLIINKKHRHENSNNSLSEISKSKSLTSSIKTQLLSIVQKLQAHSCSQIFLEPVDPKQFPDYQKFIHNPMDLSTIKKKLDKNKYQTIEEFRSDISLIFSNCNIYNPPGSWARDQGQKLEEYWFTLDKTLNQYKKKSSHERHSLPMVEVKVCESIIRKMLRNPYSAAFKDPVPTTVPMYHEIIKKPMDFTTLKTNLDNKKYSTLKEFQSDVKLIFNNCYTFNMEGSDLFVAAQKLEVAFDELWERRHDLLRQATEKLAQKGYNVKHLKHRSSTLLVNNTADDDTVSNSKSKIKMSTGNDQNDDDAILKPQRNNSNITSSSSMVNSKSKQYSSIMKEKTSSTNYQSSDARNYRKGYKKHLLEESGYIDDNNDNYSTGQEHRSKKKKVRYENNDDNYDNDNENNVNDNNDNDDMDIEYSDYNTSNKKSHDTNRKTSSIHSHHSHGHHRHSSTSYYTQDESINRLTSSRKKHSSSSRLKESSSRHDGDNDDDDDDDNNSSSNNQGNLKIKIKI
jgi:hypothetical protein